MSLEKVCKNLEQEFFKKVKRVIDEPENKSYVNPAQWAYEAYFSYTRNLDAMGLGHNYCDDKYIEARLLWEQYIQPRYELPKDAVDYMSRDETE